MGARRPPQIIPSHMRFFSATGGVGARCKIDDRDDPCRSHSAVGSIYRLVGGWMRKRCVRCWRNCWDDPDGSRDAHLDRGGSDGLASWIHWLERDGADETRREPIFRSSVRVSRQTRRLDQGALVGRRRLCLFAKRPERGRFIWPQATSGTVSLTPAQLSMLLEGIDWRRSVRTASPQVAV